MSTTKSNVRLATPKAVRNVFLAPKSLEKENNKKQSGEKDRGWDRICFLNRRMHR